MKQSNRIEPSAQVQAIPNPLRIIGFALALFFATATAILALT